MNAPAFSKKIILFESLGFGLVIVFLWLEEILDLPHLIMGASPTPINLPESLLETLVIMVLYGIIVYYSIKFMVRIRHLEGFFQVCSYCKRILVNEEWITLESFMDNYSEMKMSHGLCPYCLKEYFDDIRE